MLLRQFFLTLLISCIPQTALALDYIVERGLLIDDIHMSIQDISEAEFTPFSGAISKGFTDSAIWIKIRVKPRHDGGKLIVTVAPTFMDQISLYQPTPNEDKKWIEQRSGDYIAWQDRECRQASVRFCFEIQPQYETAYYIRTVTTNTSLMLVSVMTPEEANLTNLGRFFWEVVYLVLMLLVLLGAMYIWWLHEQQVVGWFILSQVAMLFLSFAILGYLAPLFPKATNLDLVTNIAVVTTLITQIIFHHQLLAPFGPPRFWLILFKSLGLTNLLVLASLFYFPTQQVMQINAILGFIFSLALLPAAFQAKKDAVLSRKSLRIPYILKTASWLALLMPVFGLVEATELSVYGLVIVGFISAGLMIYLLFMRSKTQHLHLRLEANSRARTQLDLAHQKQFTEEKALLLTMISHELKNHLSFVRIALSLKNMTPGLIKECIKTINDVVGIIEKCSQATDMESGKTKLILSEINLEHEVAKIIHVSEKQRRFVFHRLASPIIYADAQLLHTILHNLIENAVKYGMPENYVEVTLKLNEENCLAQILVANYPGVSGWPDRDRVFDQYYRAPKAHSVSGTGLGLYLSKGLANLLDGQLLYLQDKEKVVFCLELPVPSRLIT